MSDATTLYGLYEPGEIRECRVFNGNRTFSAYFTNPTWVIEQVIPAVERDGASAYITLNPVAPAAVTRPLHKVDMDCRTTSDRDVLKRTRLLLDFDPKRPASTSSTDAEKGAAWERLSTVREVLTYKFDYPEPLVADSGNGYHLIYGLDLPNDRGSTELVKTILVTLDDLAGSDQVSIDTSVFNAARIMTLYGTTKHKGEPTPERPHRMSRVLSVPERLEPVAKEKLEALAAYAPKRPKVRRASYTGPTGARLDLREWLAKHDIPVLGVYSWQTPEGEPVELLEVPCPFSPDDPHDGTQARVWQTEDGTLYATCHHDRCRSRGWKDFREKHDNRKVRNTT
jgi:hypothetical protein